MTTSANYTAGISQELTATPAATTISNNVNVNLTTTGTDDIVSTVAPATNNLISASATGNISTAAAVLAFAPSTNGDTAAVGTLQSVEADVTASSTNDTHSIVIDNLDFGAVRTFTGSALQDNNDITASATGNIATSSITVAAGLDVIQAAAALGSVSLADGVGAVRADLVVSSSQKIGTPVIVSSTVDSATTATRVESLDGATVKISNSDQASSTTGNAATNSIASLDTTASITASTAVANQQEIVSGAAVVAATVNSAITAASGRDSNSNDDGLVTNSTVSLTQNTQTAAATGSASTQTLTLNASSITGEPTGVASIYDFPGGFTGSAKPLAKADAVIANDQSIQEGVTVLALTAGNTIGSTVTPLANVTTSTLEVAGNTQSASATGVSTSNALSLTSGATMSATAGVASVQSMDGLVAATAEGNGVSNTQDAYNLVDSSMLTTGNTVTASATGASASNTISTTTATNNLSFAANSSASGGVLNGIAGGDEQPSVFAGMALTNDQAQTGSVLATATANQVKSSVGSDATTSTVTTDSNTLSASATGNQAGNAINLAFNALTGGISGSGTGVVAGLANDQTLSGVVTARNVGTDGNPVVTAFGSDAMYSTVSTSNNTVSATARGNVTTGNDVVVDATNITSGSEAAPSIDILTGAVSATGSFISASTQISGADILASQLDVGGTVSNTIATAFGDDIQDFSTVISDGNLLSASATANSANNAVQLGTSGTALIAASGVVANYQGTTEAGSVSAEIGTLGSDPVASFTSTNSAPVQGGTFSNLGGGDFKNNGATVSYTFAQPLTSQEQSALLAAGFQNITANSADFGAGTTVATAGYVGISYNDPNATDSNGDETLALNNFSVAGSPGVRNGAGVTVALSVGGGGAQILDSTVSVSGNTVVGEVKGNIATNTASATATTVSGLEAAATSITVGDAAVAPVGSDLATTNVQENAAALSSDVAATFAIIADNGQISEVSNSTQTVSNNLQQSFATANRATNGVVLTATNTTADTALESAQVSSALVATTSDLDVVANAGGTTSSLAMDGNRNQSVANGNIVANAITLDVTNATATGAVDASGSSSTGIFTANNALVSSQLVTSDVRATATTDVYNQDVTRTAETVIEGSNVSLSSNATIAQATGNSGAAGNTLTLGNAGTANMQRTGVLLNNQSVTAELVSSSVDQDVSVSLTNALLAPLQTSSLSLDGNSTTALARSNVITNTLSVGGANIASGVGTDATYVESTGTLSAAYVLGSIQDNVAGVSASTLQSRVAVDMTNTGGNVIDNSTLSLSGNASSATALANTAINNVSVGVNAANVDATAALGNNQTNTGRVMATGGSEVSVSANAAGINPVGINSTSVLLSGNASASNAVGNQAQNLLTTAGTNISSGTTATTASVNTVTNNAMTASAGDLLLSNQANTGSITSINNANLVTIGSSAADGSGAAASGSTLSVKANTTEARATANLVLNSSINLGSASTSSADATGMIGNFQYNSSAGVVAAEASTNTTVSLNGVGETGALNAGSAIVQGNSTLALARGNVVENALTANGANVSAGTSPATINSAPDAAILNASFGVFNEQVQQAAVTATSADARYAINASSGTGDALNAASASVVGNSVDASAFGNVATNAVTLISLNGSGNIASAAVFNGQINSGAITASATGASIGTYSMGGVTGASVGVTGNSISATSVGNFATSTVARATR